MSSTEYPRAAEEVKKMASRMDNMPQSVRNKTALPNGQG
jgi:hypothetical protein